MQSGKEQGKVGIMRLAWSCRAGMSIDMVYEITIQHHSVKVATTTEEIAAVNETIQ